MRYKTILHIGTAEVPVLSNVGGALQRRIVEMSRIQAKLGHDVTVFSPGPENRTVYHEGVRVKELALRLNPPWRTYEFLARTARILRKDHLRFDILHAHGSPMAAVALGAFARASVHSLDFFRYGGTGSTVGRRVYEYALLKFDFNLPVSEYCQREFVRFYQGHVAAPYVLFNGVNVEQFEPNDAAAHLARVSLGLPDGPLVLYLGRVCEQKGSDLLGRLAEVLQVEHPGARVVASGPPDRFGESGSSALMSHLRQSGVVCTGAVREEILAGLISAATVCVLPTRRDEMFGMAALEALASERAVVASDLGGIPEAVGPGGLLFPVGDEAAFVAQVCRLLGDPGERSILSGLGRAHAEHFAWTTIVQEAEVIYGQALSPISPGGHRRD